jgi:hypothetical protein
LPSKLGTLPSNITCQIPCRLSTASVKVSQQPKVFKEETKKGNRDYSLNDKLITELKQHLNTTNYGLRRRKRRYD